MSNSRRSDTRRTLDDLEVLHSQLEPHLRDVFAESRRDARLLSWYFDCTGVPYSHVYAVDDRVEIDAESVLAAGGEVGPRGRLVALAAAAENWDLSGPAITCVVDADRDHVLGGPESPHLLKTCVGSMDVYGFETAPLSRFLKLVLDEDRDAQGIIDALTPVLNELFLVRAVLHVDGPNVPLVERFMNCCDVSPGGGTVDTEQLLTRSLAAARATDQREQLAERLEARRALMPRNRAQAIRGHDIAPVLAKALGLRNDWAKSDVLERAWRGCLRAEELDDHPLFLDLRHRLQPDDS